jgi:uncharacterized protein YkwD
MRTVMQLAGLAILALGFFLSAQAQTGASPAERQLFVSVNRARQDQGLPALKWDEALATAARRHATMMAQHGVAEHVFPGEPSIPSRATKAGAHFVSISENVALGSDIGLIDAEFLKSPNHRANILDTDMDSIGVGVILRAGQLFAVEDFSKAK